jgi:hypothetical protein
VGPRASLDNVEKRKFLSLPGLEPRPLGRPGRSQSLYRLRYPGFFNSVYKAENINFSIQNRSTMRTAYKSNLGIPSNSTIHEKHLLKLSLYRKLRQSIGCSL